MEGKKRLVGILVSILSLFFIFFIGALLFNQSLIGEFSSKNVDSQTIEKMKLLSLIYVYVILALATSIGIFVTNAVKKKYTSELIWFSKLNDEIELKPIREIGSEVANVSSEISNKTKENISDTNTIVESLQKLTNETQNQQKMMDNSMKLVEFSSFQLKNILGNISDSKENSQELFRNSLIANENMQTLKDIYQSGTISSEQLEQFAENLHVNTSNMYELLKEISNNSEEANEIALKALNEAVSAGPSGIGFAVAINNIRQPIEKTSGLTQKIRGVMEKTQSEANEINIFINDSLNIISNQNRVIDNLVKAFENMDKVIKLNLKAIDDMESSGFGLEQTKKQIVAAIINMIETVNKNMEETKKIISLTEKHKNFVFTLDEYSNTLKNYGSELLLETDKYIK